MLGFITFIVLATAGFGNSYGYSKPVTFDGRSLMIDGQHLLLFSGSIHYPRSTPQ
ncbi:hypothetical protein Godav_003653, partial [Gossypium davidsonii]|nr:hypothetical protein [Gossypium davidsonii]